MRRVEGVIQHYAWGDPTFVPGLLGRPPDGRPWAELWLGTHPTGPAQLDDGTPLVEVTGELPYLLKVLAAASPLSLQTHPNAEQAADGHARGVYADDRAKPELLCALTRFEAFCGVRPVAATIDLLGTLGLDDLAGVVADGGPGVALEALYRGGLAVQPILDACAASTRPEAGWVCRLAARHPGDPSVAATLLLNLVVLEAGQAIRLDAGNLHAYLGGAGIELMGASDNVVRGGLTDKPVDVDELLRIVDATPLRDPVLPPARRYELPAVGVVLEQLEAGECHRAVGDELALELTGVSWYLAAGDELVPDAPAFVVTAAAA